MQHSAYIFDFDGTLVDSMPYVAMGVKNFLDVRGVKYPENIMELVTPLGYPASAVFFNEHFGTSVTGEEYLDSVQRFIYKYYENEIPLKEGVYDYLKGLRERGASLAVLTASPTHFLEPCLRRLGIYDWFTYIWSCNDFGLTKSNPEIYLRAAERLGTTSSDIAFFDDNIHSLTGAKKAGLYAVGVYDETARPTTAEMKATANVYLDSFCGAKDI